METLAGQASTAQTHEGTEEFPEIRGMERMTNGKNYESALWDLLAKKRLVDLSQFHKDGFFDEVPLFSRLSDLEFLPDSPRGRADSILLAFALKFLKSVVSYEEHPWPFFAAITIWDFPGSDRIIPNLFVWSGAIGALKKKLTLDEVETPFGKAIKKLVRQTHLRGPFDVLEDASEAVPMGRVFISLASLPYPGFVTLDKFLKTASPVG